MRDGERGLALFTGLGVVVKRSQVEKEARYEPGKWVGQARDHEQPRRTYAASKPHSTLPLAVARVDGTVTGSITPVMRITAYKRGHRLALAVAFKIVGLGGLTIMKKYLWRSYMRIKCIFPTD